MKSTTHKKLQRLGLLGLIVAYLGVSFMPPLQHKAVALSGSDFKAGHIIDDIVFTDANAMTVQDIQNFLNSKVPVCSTSHAGFTGGTGTVYSPPFVCLKDFYENPNSTYAIGYSYTNPSGATQTGSRTYYHNNAYKVTSLCPVYKGYTGTPTCGSGNYHNGLDHLIPTLQTSGLGMPSGAQSAAQIIYNAAQQYTINPQVLIVLLQKEQGLVTDDWPASYEYQSATGYGCPDTAPCSSNYAGFSNQVISAAWQFRQYLNNPSNYNYVVGGNSILYSPAAGCSSTTVNIQNQATAALYDYTPYVPNAAALANVSDSSNGGTGNSCSSYGNRNFWWYFIDWFGSTFTPAYAWQPTGLTIMDEGKNSPIPTDYMHPGERLWVEVSAENIGSETWTNTGYNPINFSTDYPKNGYTPFCDTSWVALCDRTTTLQEASVAPGQIGHFDFYMAVPNQLGAHRTYFTPVAEMKSWMNNEPWFNIYVNTTGTFDWRWMYLDAYTDSSKTTPLDITHLSRGQLAYIVLHVKNASATVWSNSGSTPTRLGTSSPQDSMSPLCTNTWLSCNRPAALDQASVAPGQEGTFSFYIKAPNKLGAYRQYVRPVLEFKGWTRDDSNQIYLDVTQ